MMNILEMARTGDISLLTLLMLTSLVIFTPITLLVIFYRKRMSVGSVILSLIPIINLYFALFLLFMGKRSAT